MGYKTPSLSSRQSPFGKAAARSLSPMQRSNLGLSKFRYMPDINNRNQSILKEVFNTEARITKNWRFNTSAIGNLFAQKPSQVPMRANIEDNLNYLRASSYEYSKNLNNPQQFLKTRVRNRSYDPILGLSSEYSTPRSYFQVFGSNVADFYKTNTLYRPNLR